MLKSASEGGALKGIMGFETRPLVSTDYTNDERSGVVDARSTMVVDGTCVKVSVLRLGLCRLLYVLTVLRIQQYKMCLVCEV